MTTRLGSAAGVMALGLGLLATVAGCGREEGTPTYPVKGKVVYKGKGDVSQLAGYRVSFETVGEPRVAGNGELEADGTFTVSCYLDGRDRVGLPAGEYRVCIGPPRSDGGEPPRPSLLQPRYASFTKSGLTVTVGSGTNEPTLEVQGR